MGEREAFNSAVRVLSANVFDALELSAFAFGGIGSGRMFDREAWSRKPILDAPYCVTGLAWWSGAIPDDALDKHPGHGPEYAISEGLFSKAVGRDRRGVMERERQRVPWLRLLEARCGPCAMGGPLCLGAGDCRRDCRDALGRVGGRRARIAELPPSFRRKGLVSAYGLNVEKCVKHLRAIGLAITAEQEAAWIAHQTKRRRDKRVVLRGMQNRCGTCGRVWQVIQQKRTKARCPDCGVKGSVEYWLLWYQKADGTVINTNAVAASSYIRGVLGGTVEPPDPADEWKKGGDK